MSIFNGKRHYHQPCKINYMELSQTWEHQKKSEMKTSISPHNIQVWIICWYTFWPLGSHGRRLPWLPCWMSSTAWWTQHWAAIVLNPWLSRPREGPGLWGSPGQDGDWGFRYLQIWDLWKSLIRMWSHWMCCSCKLCYLLKLKKWCWRCFLDVGKKHENIWEPWLLVVIVNWFVYNV